MISEAENEIIHFGREGHIPEKYLRLFNETAIEIRRPFTVAVEKVSLKFGDNPDWHFSGPASRNTLASQLYYNFCVIAVMSKLASKQSGASGGHCRLSRALKSNT